MSRPTAHMETNDQVPELMAELRQGTPGAAEKLVEIFYHELRRMAALKMRSESQSHTWQPTVLVNELYLELRKIRSLRALAQVRPPNAAEGEVPSVFGAACGGPCASEESLSAPSDESRAFLALAAQIMRRLLIHHVRPLSKRVARVSIEPGSEPAISGEEALHELESVLAGLGAIDSRLRVVVEMRVFGGFSGEEVAQRLGCTARTVTRYWTFARNWLEDHYAIREQPRN